MTILESAIRRILIRSVDRTISTVGRNTVYDISDYKPSLPTIGSLISSIILFAILTFVITSIFILFNLEILAYITPLLFIGGIYRPLASNFIYGKKQVPVTVRDRRFSSEERIVGYRWVRDKDKKFEFTREQVNISKLEGIIKLLITGLIILNIHTTVKSIEHRQNNLDEQEVLRLLQPGDTVFAKSDISDILVKVKETSYWSSFKGKREVSYENISFETAYKDSLKVLGLFVAKDTSESAYSSIYTYLSILPLHSTGWKFTKQLDTLNEREITRADTLFYIKLADATVSPSKLSINDIR